MGDKAGLPDMLNCTLRSLEDTEQLGRFLGEMSRPGDVILLSGTLGAGKTTLTQFIAKGLAVPGEWYVTSPSFNLLNEYPGRIPLYHMDCYRLEGEDDVEESGLVDYIAAGGLTVIEWPDRLGSLTPPDRLDIMMTSGENEERNVSLKAHGQKWRKRLRVLKKKLFELIEGTEKSKHSPHALK
jgi:tRNA threonylcarbamoyladenosine biosynthesis protein TsaE